MTSGGNEQTMTAISIIEPARAEAMPADFTDWVQIGRELIHKRRQLDWEIADWVLFGSERFPEQVEMALADMTDDPRALRRVERVARAFPPHLRQPALTFDHHAHVADMPTQEALPLLQRSAREKLTARQLRIEAMLRKVETGQILPREDDPEDEALMALVRAWNRAPKPAREDFAEMVAESHLGLIEFDA